MTGSLHLVGGVLSLLDPELNFFGSEKHADSSVSHAPLSVSCANYLTVPETP